MVLKFFFMMDIYKQICQGNQLISNKLTYQSEHQLIHPDFSHRSQISSNNHAKSININPTLSHIPKKKKKNFLDFHLSRRPFQFLLLLSRLKTRISGSFNS